ncbi:L-galactonate dehydratase [Tuber indicum]|nr:L-galactonate dehydratase [Tuber indicum]
MVQIIAYESRDVRFPTSLDKTGSDAMNEAGDYSAAYCILKTDGAYSGHGMTFTIGRGNDIVCRAIEQVAQRITSHSLESLTADMGKTWRWLVSDSQLRWIGPEKGVTHLALGAVVNALWDLWSKEVGKPLWRLVADMSPEEFVRCIDFRHDKMKTLLHETLAQGYKHFKIKVGGSVEEDRRRLRTARDIIGYDKGNVLMIDANQDCLVRPGSNSLHEPTRRIQALVHRRAHLPRRHLRPRCGVATGEMCQNRVMFKQLLQAQAIDVCQIDACRMGGVNEVLAVLLMAKKFGVPIVPHSGGVGLPEYTQHLSTIDYVAVSGKLSLLEYVDHLHEHFLHPSVIKEGYYVTPTNPGYSVEMKESAFVKFSFPSGEFWESEEAKPILNHLSK